MHSLINLFQLSGMHCSSCEKLITKKFLKIKDVENVKVDIKTGLVKVIANRPIQTVEIKAVIADTQYTVIK
jgi:copper chaperone CopZ